MMMVSPWLSWASPIQRYIPVEIDGDREAYPLVGETTADPAIKGGDSFVFILDHVSSDVRILQLYT